MNRTFFICTLFLLASFIVKAQECNCPPAINNDNDGKPNMVFRFGNQRQLGICGYVTVEGNDTTYTKFTLFHCTDGTPVKDWSEDKTCKIEKIKDTLFIMDIYGLPVGQNFSTIPRPFYIHKFFFKNGELKEVEYFKKGIVKYSSQQIQDAIIEYKSLPKTSNEQTIHVANMLFCAYISGSKEAEGYFTSIPGKFGPFDGVISQEWDDIFTTYQDWKNMNNIK
jgi:hypothetical protein